MMLLTIEKYFLEHGHLMIPSIGQIILDQQDAQLMNEQYHAPIEKIIFEPIGEEKTKPSKLFYIYLSDYLDCTIEQAMIDYASFFTNQLQHNNTIDLGSIGQLSLVNGQYALSSNFNKSTYYQSLQINKVLVEDQSENNFTDSKTNWWWLPLLIAISALLAILLK